MAMIKILSQSQKELALELGYNRDALVLSNYADYTNNIVER